MLHAHASLVPSKQSSGLTPSCCTTLKRLIGDATEDWVPQAAITAALFPEQQAISEYIATVERAHRAFAWSPCLSSCHDHLAYAEIIITVTSAAGRRSVLPGAEVWQSQSRICSFAAARSVSPASVVDRAISACPSGLAASALAGDAGSSGRKGVCGQACAARAACKWYSAAGAGQAVRRSVGQRA